jgi:predicted nicotinamide N-methyase
MRVEKKIEVASRVGPDTLYDGPVGISTPTIGGRTMRLVRPTEPDRLLDAPEVLAWNRRDDYMPYWAYLWPGATLLAEAVAREAWEPGLSALEIGCGLGLAGLVALGRGLRVRFTDYDEAPLRFVARSARENGFDPSSYSTGLLDWRDPPGDERYPVILGADVLYERRLVPLVAGVLSALLEPGGVALIADPNRSAADDFGACLATRGLRCEARAVATTTDEHGPVRGRLYRIGRER